MNKKDILEIKGIGRKTAGSLKKAGFNDIGDLHRASLEQLSMVSGVGTKKARDIKKQVNKVMEATENERMPPEKDRATEHKLFSDEPGDDTIWGQKKGGKRRKQPILLRYIAVSMAIIFVMGGLIGYSVSHMVFTQEIDELHDKIGQLEEQFQSPQSNGNYSFQIDDLQSQIHSLEEQIEGLVYPENSSIEISVLLNQIRELEDQVAACILSQNITEYEYCETTLSDLYDTVSRSIVGVRAFVVTESFFGTYYSEVGGSGFIINVSGQQVVVTNYHVVQNTSNITITLSGGTTYSASLLGYDPYADLAVLTVASGNVTFAALTMISSSTLEVGDPVIAIGNPFGLTGSVTTGIVSQLGRTIQESLAGDYAIANIIQVSAPINPGNSGGPLLNYNGDVIGITTAIIADSQGVGFAVPSSTILREIDSLVANGSYDQHAWLGVYGTDLTFEVSQALGINKTYGWLVRHAVEDGPADQAGVRGGTEQIQVLGSYVMVGGDLIIAIDGHRIINGDSLLSYLAEYTVPGQVIEITIIRDNQILEIPVELGVRPPPPS